MKTAILKRLDLITETVGQFSCGTFFCSTLELPWLNNKPQVSCIPTGTYDVKWTYSPSFKKFTYEIQNVKGRSGIRIHSGNYASSKKTDVLGCVLLGNWFKDINSDGIVDITESTATIKRFEEFFNKEDFKLKII